MKTDLISSIGVAVLGVIVSYFICNILVSTWTTDSYTVKTLESEVTADITDPDSSVFNYRALNPTVEVYVGSCKEFDSNGQCLDGDDEDINQDIIDNIIPDSDEDDWGTENDQTTPNSQKDEKQSSRQDNSRTRKEE